MERSSLKKELFFEFIEPLFTLKTTFYEIRYRNNLALQIIIENWGPVEVKMMKTKVHSILFLCRILLISILYQDHYLDVR